MLCADFTADDLSQALVANWPALLHRPKPKREDYDRRGRFFLSRAGRLTFSMPYRLEPSPGAAGHRQVCYLPAATLAGRG